MNFIPLGVDAAYPKPDGACSSYLIYTDNTKIVMDLGAAALSKLVKRFDPMLLDAMFISHWHADHCSDIFSLSYYYKFNSNGDKKLKIYTVEDNDSNLYKEALANKYFDIINIEPGMEISINDLKITVGKAKHPVKAIMFKIEHDNKSLIYTGDTNYFEGLDSFINNADVLIADACFTHDVWSDSKPHLSAKLAAEIAKKAKVKSLILSHISPLINPDDILFEAKEIFPNSHLIKALKVYLV